MRLLNLTVSLCLIVYAWAGNIYEVEKPVIVLDGKVVDAETRKPVPPTRKDDGTCPRCRKFMDKNDVVFGGGFKITP